MEIQGAMKPITSLCFVSGLCLNLPSTLVLPTSQIVPLKLLLQVRQTPIAEQGAAHDRPYVGVFYAWQTFVQPDRAFRVAWAACELSRSTALPIIHAMYRCYN